MPTYEITYEVEKTSIERWIVKVWAPSQEAAELRVLNEETGLTPHRLYKEGDKDIKIIETKEVMR